MSQQSVWVQNQSKLKFPFIVKSPKNNNLYSKQLSIMYTCYVNYFRIKENILINNYNCKILYVTVIM